MTRRDSAAPAICPNCTLLVRPIFLEAITGSESMPNASPQALAEAIQELIQQGAGVINLSLTLVQPSTKGERTLEEALHYAATRGVLVIAAAGNQGMMGSSALARHPWVIPVIACDLQGRPVPYSNLSHAIGRQGLCTPGEGITSLSPAGESIALIGTSVATPFVTGAIALLWSEFPRASAVEVKNAVIQTQTARRTTVVPPLLNAWAAYQILAKRTNANKEIRKSHEPRKERHL